MDPRLQSIHLELNPRREDFRAARLRLQSSIQNRTLEVPFAAPRQKSGLSDLEDSFLPSDCWLIDRGRKLPLKLGLNSIGRFPDNDVVVEDPMISRRHCAIVIHGRSHAELHDFASKNGTTVNGKKFSGFIGLQSGDVIGICDRRLVVVLNDGELVSDQTISIPRSYRDDITLVG